MQLKITVIKEFHIKNFDPNLGNKQHPVTCSIERLDEHQPAKMIPVKIHMGAKQQTIGIPLKPGQDIATVDGSPGHPLKAI
jgi:hypothetical protein